MKQLSKTYEPKIVEQRIYRLWEKSGFFNPDKLKVKSKKSEVKSYTIVIPPPNITGSLHMGHALNSTTQDILIRWRRMQGYKTLWLPGTDHAGIATQNVVEKELKKEGKTRHDLGREKFLKMVWAWREKYGNIILDQLKKLGASCDWSRTRFTMDPEYIKAVETAFSHYFEKGWIYQGERVINWCPRCSTSLSDLELEYKEEKGKLWYIHYPLKQNLKSEIRNPKQAPNSKSQTLNYITVATTRPETMLGDAAVAVNPSDERYKDLVGEMVILPIQNREIPIIADRLVDLSFGTGVVKITPCHDLADFEISERHGLPKYQIIDENGKMTTEAGKICEGLNVLECRKKVVEELGKQGFLEKIEDYLHRVSKCDRCGATTEPLLSKQWFLKMDELAKLAIKAVKKGKVKFHPKKWEKAYLDWLKNIKDWCISRQIWWGHRIPVWRCQTGILKSKIKSQKLKIDDYYFVSFRKPVKCPICKKCRPKQEKDVLDTWFSSALWPFATLGWPIAYAQMKNAKGKRKKYCAPKPGSDLSGFYPTDVLSTDRGIINLWVARMIFSSYEFLGVKPFEDVYIHATVLTREGKRMSKSLGTGIDPLDLIEKYGADATRFGLIWQAMGGQDIRFGEEHFLAGKKLCNKLWNASRFVMGQTAKLKIKNQKSKVNIKNLSIKDKEFLKKLKQVIRATNNDLEEFRFGQALHRLYDFFWHEFCDKYIEYSKSKISTSVESDSTSVDRQNSKSKIKKEQTQKLLLAGLITSLKLLHPFIPFVTEEIYQKLPMKSKKLLLTEQWPK